MTEEPLDHQITTENATALGVSLLLEKTAEGLQEIEGTETRRYSLELRIKEQ